MSAVQFAVFRVERLCSVAVQCSAVMQYCAVMRCGVRKLGCDCRDECIVLCVAVRVL